MTGTFIKGPETHIYTGRIMTLVVGSFETPEGDTIEREIVRHPGAVAAVALDGDEVILVRQFRAPLDRPLLEVVAGRRDQPGEPPEETAHRELQEEIGVAAGSLELLCGFVNSPGLMDEYTFCYLATDLTSVGREAHGVEERHMSIERFPLAEVPGLIASGEIEDAKTIISLLLTRDRLSG